MSTFRMLGSWLDNLENRQRALALMGLGLLKTYPRPGPGALPQLQKRLQDAPANVHTWRFDHAITDAFDWRGYPTAAQVAAVMELALASASPLRIGLLPGSSLPVVQVRSDVLRYLPPDEVVMHVIGPRASRPVRIRWPIRIGCLSGPENAKLQAELNDHVSWDGKVYRVSTMSRRHPECDVLVLPVADPEVILERVQSARRALDGIRAQCILLHDRKAVPLPALLQLDRIREAVKSSGVIWLQDAGSIGVAVRNICAELSHNHTLDVALARATGTRALLFAHASLLQATRLSDKARAVADALRSSHQSRRPTNPSRLGRLVDAGAQPESQEEVFEFQGVPAGVAAAADEGASDEVAPERPLLHARTNTVAAIPTRGEIGMRLHRAIPALEWDMESQAASALGDALLSLEEEDDDNAEPRFLQAGFTLPETPGTPVPRGLKPAMDYLVQVFIDALRDGYASAGSAFPDLPPTDDGRDHDLEVVFWEPVLCPKPVLGHLSLPPVGASGRCSFKLRTNLYTRAVHARISVLHRNRVLQTGVLKAAVGSEEAVCFELDAIPRVMLAELDERQNFSWSLVLNDSEGQGVAHSMLEGEPTTLDVDHDDIKGLVNSIGIAMAGIVLNPANYEGLRKPGSVELLRKLAQKGATLREYLRRHAVRSGTLRAPQLVQIVATKPGKIFPLEFVYEYQAPREEATLCEHAEEALVTGHCPGTCPSHDTAPDAMAGTICPMGFWGLRCAIERREHKPDDNELRGDYQLILEPRRQTRVLQPLASAVVGATSKVNRVVPTSVSDMMDRIEVLVPGAKLVDSWHDWVTAVADCKPATLTLVVHQELDALNTPMLDIGSAPMLSSDLIERRHVRPSDEAARPLVLLIGCETAKADIGYENAALHFQWQGAALVVCTIAEVLGRHAAPVTAEILEAINEVREPTSFAVVMRDLRRRLLARGTPMVLALVAQGDADWEVVR